MDISSGLPTILCCACGTPIQPNPSNMCILCLQSNINITEGLKADGSILFCKHCERYLNPPKYWVDCALESKELLTICLKHIRGLNKVTLVDATFVWTEPHSKRLKVKVTVQKEIFSSGSSTDGGDNAAIQQCAVIEFVVSYQMCEYCQKVAQNQEIWTAAVQVRQRVDHKKTFLFLEQAILKHDMHTNCTKVSEVPDGLDFFYGHKGHAQSMVDFIGTLTPIKCRTAEELISHDTKSNVAEVHHTFAIEIAPICKDDLVCLPPKYSNAMGGLGPLTICLKTNSNIVLVDPSTCRIGQIPGHLYWKAPFVSLCASRQATEFYVMDIETIEDSSTNSSSNKKYRVAEVQVCRASEVGQGSVYCCKTHLGNALHVGDSALGYFLGNINTNNEDLRHYRNFQVPDVVLIKRFHQKSTRSRAKWELKELQKEQKREPRKSELSQKERDRQEFMEDLEDDEELRAHVVLYKNKKSSSKVTPAVNEEDDGGGVDDAMNPEENLAIDEEDDDDVEGGEDDIDDNDDDMAMDDDDDNVE